MGIEPTPSSREADALPLSYIRNRNLVYLADGFKALSCVR